MLTACVQPTPDKIEQQPLAPPLLADQQDFDTVATVETIETDRQKILLQQSKYQLVLPKPVPQRPKDLPNVAEYVFTGQHTLGIQKYNRTGLQLLNNHSRACSVYAHPIAAQEAFLAGGGPVRDRNNLDPDGDGFACGFTPQPYLSMLASIFEGAI